MPWLLWKLFYVYLNHCHWQLRTAALTLILVVVFIVALSSIDAALSYILSWLLRKSA
uniref:Uncharacterized protein n=1 Tax=Aegilops tauschii subsp. strangulata TaxID=200361 RepID=A0A453KYW6_AEGTS